MITSRNGHVKLLALLLDRGADPSLANKMGATAAHIACEVGHVKCVLLLIKRGVNINTRDDACYTPLDYARIFKHSECEDLLLSNDAVGMDVADLRVMGEAEKVCICSCGCQGIV